jgi:hypothetical protein
MWDYRRHIPSANDIASTAACLAGLFDLQRDDKAFCLSTELQRETLCIAPLGALVSFTVLLSTDIPAYQQFGRTL